MKIRIDVLDENDRSVLTLTTPSTGVTEDEVYYLVPVVATVEDGDVTKVQVWDESVYGPLDSGSAEAEDVAEGATWPGWSFG